MTTLTTEKTPIAAASRSEFYRKSSSGGSAESASSLKEKANKKIHKMCDRAIPVTKSQKRSRYIPGKRYFPLLWIQWLWHPVTVLWNGIKREKLQDNHHHHHHHHHGHHIGNDEHKDEILDNNVLGDGSEGKMNVIANDHELLMD